MKKVQMVKLAQKNKTEKHRKVKNTYPKASEISFKNVQAKRF